MIAKVLLFSAVLCLAASQTFLSEDSINIDWVGIETVPTPQPVAPKVNSLPQCFQDLQQILPKLVDVVQQLTSPNPNVIAVITEITQLIPVMEQAITDCTSNSKFLAHVKGMGVTGMVQCFQDLSGVIPQIVAVIQQATQPNPNIVQIIEELTQLIPAIQKAISDCTTSQPEPEEVPVVVELPVVVIDEADYDAIPDIEDLADFDFESDQGIAQCIQDIETLFPKVLEIFQQATGPNPNVVQIVAELTAIIPQINQAVTDCTSQLSPEEALLLPDPALLETPVNAFPQCIQDIEAIFPKIVEIVNQATGPSPNIVAITNDLIQLVPQIQQAINDCTSQLEAGDFPVMLPEEPKPQGLPQCLNDIQQIIPKVVEIFQQSTGPNPDFLEIINQVLALFAAVQQAVTDCSSSNMTFNFPKRNLNVKGDTEKCITDINTVVQDVQEIVNAIQNFPGDIASIIQVLQTKVNDIVAQVNNINVDCNFSQRKTAQAVLERILDEVYAGQQ